MLKVFIKKSVSYFSEILYPFGKLAAIIRNRRKYFPNELAVCAIFKDESAYLNEWLTFHQGVGVDHFYLYNDASSDDYIDTLAPWMSSGVVTLKNWNGRGQVNAYNDCIRKHRNDSRWIAFIDLDEFLFSPSASNLQSMLSEYEDVSSIFVYWILFGSSGHVQNPGGSVIENYIRCLDHDGAIRDDFDHGDVPGKHDYVSGWAQDGKSIVNPRLVRQYNIHKPKSLWRGQPLDEMRNPVLVRGKAKSLSYSRFRINHYWSKSLDELTQKVTRGSVCNPNRPPRKLHRWLAREAMLNGSVDTTVLPIWTCISAGSRTGEVNND